MDKILFLFLGYLDFICTNTIICKIHLCKYSELTKTNEVLKIKNMEDVDTFSNIKIPIFTYCQKFKN